MTLLQCAQTGRCMTVIENYLIQLLQYIYMKVNKRQIKAKLRNRIKYNVSNIK